MPKGVYNRSKKMAEATMASNVDLSTVNAAAAGMARNIPFQPFEPDKVPAPEPVKMFPVHLLKNYRPKGDYEVVGYQRAAVEKKNPAGVMEVVEPARFVEGEKKPSPFPGAGFENKIWAGTRIMLPIDEARALCDGKRAERADAIA